MYAEGFIICLHVTDVTDDHQHGPTAPKVWGAAYHIPPEHVEEVRSYLDIREINGYSIQFTPIHPSLELVKIQNHSEELRTSISEANSSPINCLVYIGLPDNPQFLGPQDPQALAEHILHSKGPSGENKEYLYMLDAALNELSPDSADDHISDLARRCRELESKRTEQEERRDDTFKNELQKGARTEEHEEVEKQTSS